MLKQLDIKEIGIQTLKQYLISIPNITILDTTENKQKEVSLDFQLSILLKSDRIVIAGIIKSQAYPKTVRDAVNALLQYKVDNPEVYGVLIAPFISPESASICKEAGMGYVDLSGNCRISFQEVFLLRENYPNKYISKTHLSSLFSPKAQRIIRVLLTCPYYPWKTLQLAKEADVSPGMISHVRKILDDEEWIETTKEGFRLIQPKELLKKWSDNYSIKKNSIFEFYTLKPQTQIEQEFADVCQEMNIRYALTGFSASNRLAPIVRNQRVMVYITTEKDYIAERLALKPVSSGSNINVLMPYDEGVLWNSKEIQGVNTVTPIQAYLDLIHLRGRGEEAADFLYKEVIQTEWQHQKTIMTNCP